MDKTQIAEAKKATANINVDLLEFMSQTRKKMSPTVLQIRSKQTKFAFQVDTRRKLKENKKKIY